jgi:hypothetical protein
MLTFGKSRSGLFCFGLPPANIRTTRKAILVRDNTVPCITLFHTLLIHYPYTIHTTSIHRGYTTHRIRIGYRCLSRPDIRCHQFIGLQGVAANCSTRYKVKK